MRLDDDEIFCHWEIRDCIFSGDTDRRGIAVVLYASDRRGTFWDFERLFGPHTLAGSFDRGIPRVSDVELYGFDPLFGAEESAKGEIYRRRCPLGAEESDVYHLRKESDRDGTDQTNEGDFFFTRH